MVTSSLNSPLGSMDNLRMINRQKKVLTTI